MDVASEKPSLLLKWNRQALQNLNSHHLTEAFTVLIQAKNASKQDSGPLRAMTYNNLACYYQHAHDYANALRALNKALSCRVSTPQLAATHLNLCAVKAQLDWHEEALEHALKAQAILKADFRPETNCVHPLVVAYHNAGLEYEALDQRSAALRSYQYGMELALEQLGRTHPLTQALAITHKQALRIKLQPPAPEMTVVSENNELDTPFTSEYQSSDASGLSAYRFISGNRLQPMNHRLARKGASPGIVQRRDVQEVIAKIRAQQRQKRLKLRNKAESRVDIVIQKPEEFPQEVRDATLSPQKLQEVRRTLKTVARCWKQRMLRFAFSHWRG